MRGELEWGGRRFPNVQSSQGDQSWHAGKNPIVEGGRLEGHTERREAIKMNKASQDSLNPGPVLTQIMVRDSSTVVENFMEFDLASQRNACKSSAPYVNSRTVLEGTNKEQFISAATFKGPLNAGVDKDPTTTILPKNKLSGPTWKRSMGRKKSTLYEVLVFHITGAKRNTAESGVDEEVGAKGGKRSKGDI
ncbi:hypothetical protein FCV25MIE_30105, partial [Fagus crenata]